MRDELVERCTPTVVESHRSVCRTGGSGRVDDARTVEGGVVPGRFHRDHGGEAELAVAAPDLVRAATRTEGVGPDEETVLHRGQDAAGTLGPLAVG